MSRLRAGGLALVINDKFQENIGIVVQLLKFKGYQESFGGNSYDDGWLVKGLNQELKGQQSDTGFIFHVSKAVTSAKNLMPLGDKETQDELSKEKSLEFN